MVNDDFCAAMRFTIVANDSQRLGESIHKRRLVSIATRQDDDSRVAMGRKGPVTQEVVIVGQENAILAVSVCDDVFVGVTGEAAVWCETDVPARCLQEIGDALPKALIDEKAGPFALPLGGFMSFIGRADSTPRHHGNLTISV